MICEPARLDQQHVAVVKPELLREAPTQLGRRRGARLAGQFNEAIGMAVVVDQHELSAVVDRDQRPLGRPRLVEFGVLLKPDPPVLDEVADPR